MLKSKHIERDENKITISVRYKLPGVATPKKKPVSVAATSPVSSVNSRSIGPISSFSDLSYASPKKVERESAARANDAETKIDMDDPCLSSSREGSPSDVRSTVIDNASLSSFCDDLIEKARLFNEFLRDKMDLQPAVSEERYHADTISILETDFIERNELIMSSCSSTGLYTDAFSRNSSFATTPCCPEMSNYSIKLEQKKTYIEQHIAEPAKTNQLEPFRPTPTPENTSSITRTRAKRTISQESELVYASSEYDDVFSFRQKLKVYYESVHGPSPVGTGAADSSDSYDNTQSLRSEFEDNDSSREL